MTDKVVKTDKEWRELLTPEQYWITREKGTERPSTGKYYHFKGEGEYLCVACGNDLFDSETKYDSGSGWPSMTRAQGGPVFGRRSPRRRLPPSGTPAMAWFGLRRRVTGAGPILDTFSRMVPSPRACAIVLTLLPSSL